jgi:hypothetical protein
MEWQKTLGGSTGAADLGFNDPGDDFGYSVRQTFDGGYVVAGQTYSLDGDVSGNHGNFDIWVVKLSATGVLQWQKCLGGTEYDDAYSIQQTSDGGYIVVGTTESSDGNVTGYHGNTDMWVVKLGKKILSVTVGSMAPLIFTPAPPVNPPDPVKPVFSVGIKIPSVIDFPFPTPSPIPTSPVEWMDNASFVLKLSEGMTIDVENTQLADALQKDFTLSITQEGTRETAYRFFTITPNQTESVLTRAGEVTPEPYEEGEALLELVKIAYTIAENATDKSHRIEMLDLYMSGEDWEYYQEEAYAVTLQDGIITANSIITGGGQIWSSGSNLYVKTSTQQPLTVYALTGTLIKEQVIPQGTTVISLERGIYMVKLENKVQKIAIR